MKTTKHGIFAVLMAALMVLTFIPAMAFADDAGPWVWSEDKSSATYNGYEAEVTSEVTAPTCEADGYTVFTATYGSHVDTVKVIAEDSALGHAWGNPIPVAQKVDNTYTDIYATYECERDGCDATAKSTTVRVRNDEADVVEATCWKDGGASWSVTVKFQNNDVHLTVARDKQSMPSHDKAHKVEHHNAVAPTCTTEGAIEYYFCTEDNKYFDAEKNEIQSDGIVVDAKGHKYGSRKYVWADDGSKCVASVLCKDCDNEVKVEGIITSEKTKDPTCTNKGETTYTATFDNELFETQTKVVADIAPVADNHVWEVISYAKDYDYCSTYIVATAICKDCNEGLTKTSVVNYSNRKGDVTGVAKFDAPFKDWTENYEIVSKMTVKTNTVKAKASKKTKIAASKVFVISNPASNIKSEISYKKVSGNKKITVAKNGKITVKKGLKAGKTYTVKVKVTDGGGPLAKGISRTVSVKIKVTK